MTTKTMLALVFLSVFCSAASAQTTLTGTTVNLTVDYEEGGPDGAAAGDMDGDGRSEVAYVIRYGRANAAEGSQYDSSLAVYNVSGSGPTMSLRFQIEAGAYVGFPSFADFDADGQDEVAVCELTNTPTGACRVYDDDGAELSGMAVTGLMHASMTNGGPAAADITEDGHMDLIVTTYGGEIILKPGNGASVPVGFPYDLWTSHSDWLFGHVAVGDVLDDGHQQIVVGGAATGSFYVIDRNGSLVASSPAQYDSVHDEGYFYLGSGPTLADLDDDGDLEVISILDYYSASESITGGKLTVHSVAAGSTTLLAELTLPSSVSFSTPVIGDLDGDNDFEIILMDNAGSVRAYSYGNGSLSQVDSAAVDSSSWCTPALLDADADGDVEVAVTGSNGVYVLDGGLNVTHQWSASSQSVFPQPIVVDADGDGSLELFTGTWATPRLVALNLPFLRNGEWSALGGDATHGGSIAVSGEAVVSDNPAIETFVVLQGLVALAGSPPSGCNSARLTNARNYVDLSHREYLRGNPHLSIDYLRQAQSQLQSAGNNCAVRDYWRERIAYTSQLEFRQYLDRSKAVMGANYSAVTAAERAYATSTNHLEAGSWANACTTNDNAALALRNALDNGGYNVSTTSCTSGNPEIFLHWMCEMIDVYAQDADDDLRSVIVWMPDLVFGSLLPFADDAANGINNTTLRHQFANALMKSMRIYLDHATLWFQDIDPSALAAAEAYYEDAVDEMASGPSRYDNAMVDLSNAYNQAVPCAGDSFGGNAQGLQGGGCSP